MSESNPIVTTPSRLEVAQKHLESARLYMLTLLDDLNEEDWFWQPTEGITHIAWQVGHLAMAEYGLVLFRQRGRQPIDGELMSGKFRKKFAKGSEPKSDSAEYPKPEEILQVLHRVHEQALKELQTFADEDLDQPVDPPHAAFANRYGALLFAGDHEMLHAGQIGLLRRLMGKPPMR